MYIKKCLLDIKNNYVVDGLSIGSLIAESGKNCLWNERSDEAFDAIVIHYISAIETNPQAPYEIGKILKIFCDYGVSSHFVINRDGDIFQTVPVERRAWHCGGSIMPSPDNRKNVNDFSIGIELTATADSGFTASQYDALSDLSIYLEKTYNKQFTYVGHEDIAGRQANELGLRKDIKIDPGVLFNWELFKQKLNSLRQYCVC